MLMPQYITKTSYIDGILCPKYLWDKVHEPSKLPPETSIDKLRMADGQLVGQKARELFPDGIRLERALDPGVMHERSMEALKLRKPLFEAGFIYKCGYALADILLPVGRDEWDLYEVKASTSIDTKTVHTVLSGNINYYYADVAFQKYVYKGAGIKLRKSSLMHLNKNYIYDGKKLLISELIKPDEELDSEIIGSIRAGIEAHIPYVEENIDRLLKMLAQKTPPEVKIGRYCKGCIFERECEKEFGLPEKGNVMRLRYDRDGLRFEMLEQKIYKMGDIELTAKIKDPKRTQIEATKQGRPVMKKKLLAGFLKKVKYPAYFLDFETIAPAVPIYANTHTYQQIPFMFSLHVVKEKDAPPEHFSYIAPGEADPRPEIILRLKKLLGGKGSIIAYNVAFERGRIEEACLGDAENEDWFNNNIKDRMLDLEEPFDKFYYYDPKQEESTSLKAVYPALTGKDAYEGLGIAEGGDAMKKYFDIIFNKVGEKEKVQILKDLEKYCAQDTMAMVEILEKLRNI